MIANIYHYAEGQRKARIRKMLEFDQLLDEDIERGSETIRVITFHKGSEVVDAIEFRDDPLMIFIMENGKTVDRIRYNMDDVI